MWLSVDPLAEKYPNRSPYEYTFSNPIKYVDPDGRDAAPIYGTDGNLLGTDDQGMKGRPIVMNEENFKQGMSHDEAVSHSTYIKGKSEFYGFESKEALGKYASTQSNLKNRPDYDGYLTLGEANEWYRNGDGKSLFVDASKIDLSPVKTADFNSEGDSFYKNYALTSNTSTGLVYGSIKLTLTDKESRTVRLGGSNRILDIYDFDQKKPDGSVKTFIRNTLTTIGETVAGEGKPFKIYSYGDGKLKK